MKNSCEVLTIKRFTNYITPTHTALNVGI